MRWRSAASPELVEGERARDGDVEGFGPGSEWNHGDPVAGGGDLFRQPFTLGSQDERRALFELELGQRLAFVRPESDAGRRRLLEACERDPEDRAHRGAQSLRRGWIGTPGRERHEGGSERIRGPHERADVAWISNVPKGDPDGSLRATRKIRPPEDRHYARGVRERREVGHQLGRDALRAGQ